MINIIMSHRPRPVAGFYSVIINQTSVDTWGIVMSELYNLLEGTLEDNIELIRSVLLYGE